MSKISFNYKKLLFLNLLLFFIFSCSAGSVEDEKNLIEDTFPAVTNSGLILGIDDFKLSGFKHLREYKEVDELPPLIEAHHGIFKKMDYELRFYASHIEALSRGTEDAKLVTGKEGIVTGDVPWEDGEKDRRRCSRAASQPHSGCNYTAKYADFVIFENVVVMCEGKDVLESRVSCSNILSLIKATP